MDHSFYRRAFEPNDFTYSAAFSLGVASELAYWNEPEVDEAAREWGMSISFIEVGETQGFFAEDDELVILAFRGTERKFRDWLTDLRVIPTKHPGGQVHRGFSRALDLVWDSKVLPVLEQINGRKCWITGHSVGGALASLAAARTREAGLADQITGICTFGQPRLSALKGGIQDGFDREFGSRFYRFVNHRDIVTRLPPLYNHVGGDPIHFDEEGNLPIDHDMEYESDLDLGAVERGGAAEEDVSDLEYEELCESLEMLRMEAGADLPFDDPFGSKDEKEGMITGVETLVDSILNHEIVNGYLKAIAKHIPNQ